MAHIIVVGNEKGGSGKTTCTMHLIANLLELGLKTASIDLDIRQKSLSRYLENRARNISETGAKLYMPDHIIFVPHKSDSIKELEQEDANRFSDVVESLQNNDFIIIDTPGSDTHLSRFAHSFADTVITPINDSFVDLDVLVRVNPNNLEIEKPSIYSETIWQQKLMRAQRDRGSIEWVVLRNRLSNLDAKNKRNMEVVLDKFSKRLGCRILPGFSERVIFRELFLRGITLLDLEKMQGQVNLSISHIAAKQELRNFIKSLNIKEINAVFSEMSEAA